MSTSKGDERMFVYVIIVITHIREIGLDFFSLECKSDQSNRGYETGLICALKCSRTALLKLLLARINRIKAGVSR